MQIPLIRLKVNAVSVAGNAEKLRSGKAKKNIKLYIKYVELGHVRLAETEREKKNEIMFKKCTT